MANTALPPEACLVKSWIWFTAEPVGTVMDWLALAETVAPLAHLRLRPAGPLPSGSDCTLMELLDSVMSSACKREPTMVPVGGGVELVSSVSVEEVHPGSLRSI